MQINQSKAYTSATSLTANKDFSCPKLPWARYETTKNHPYSLEPSEIFQAIQS